MLQNLYDFAKFQYNCGNYSGAAEMLYHFRILVSDLYYYYCKIVANIIGIINDKLFINIYLFILNYSLPMKI